MIRLLTKDIIPFIIVLVLFSCKTTVPVVVDNTKASFAQIVNPFIGTTPLTDSSIVGFKVPDGWRPWSGLVYPGSALPNAMVQLSPITEFGSGAGYEYMKILLFMGLPIPIRVIGIYAIFPFCLFRAVMVQRNNSHLGFPINQKQHMLVITKYFLP